MDVQRWKSAYVTLNLAWFFGVCALCFLAGLVVMGMQGSQVAAEQEVLTCAKCGEPVYDEMVVFHKACLPTWGEPDHMSESPEAKQLLQQSFDGMVGNADQDTGH